MMPPRAAPLPSLALATALLAPLALAGGGGGASPTGVEDYLFAAGGAFHVQARYFDGLGSTKMAFVMLQGQSGEADNRLSPGARCTEWHGTFTQVAVKARYQDGTAIALLSLAGFAAAVPPEADGARSEPGFLFDALGGPGSFAGRLLVCDHPDGLGLVDFEGAPAPMPFTHVPADPVVVQIEDGA